MSLALVSFFFFNDTATTEIYTLSLHDALPIWPPGHGIAAGHFGRQDGPRTLQGPRSEEHTSELQSPCNLVCRLLLEKKKKPSGPVTALPDLAALTPHCLCRTSSLRASQVARPR